MGWGRNLAQLEFLRESEGATFWSWLVRHLIHFIIISCGKFVVYHFRHTNLCSSVVELSPWGRTSPGQSRGLMQTQVPAISLGSRGWLQGQTNILIILCVLNLAVQPAEVFWLAATREHYGIVSFPKQGVVNYSGKGFFYVSEESYCALYQIEDIKPRF